MVGTATDDELDSAAEQLRRLLPADFRSARHLPGLYAGQALVDVAIVALGQGDEVHDDILYTTVLYSAAAHGRVGAEALATNPARLSKAEWSFLEDWWQRCIKSFPSLVSCQVERER